MFFKKKPKVVLRWIYDDDVPGCESLTIIVKSIKPFKWSPFGVNNSSGAFSYVPHAMQISGHIKKTTTAPDTSKEQDDTVMLLVPRGECAGIEPDDVLKASLLRPTRFFKLEKLG